MGQSSVIFENDNGVGVIRLNRPKALNSLTEEMVELIYQQLLDWKDDPSIALISMSGEGEKGFSAGGDMKTLYNLRDTHVEETAYQFFSVEYLLDMLIHFYPKPVLAYMDGFVMGGGVGLTSGASHRIVTEKTKWSMPEMNIGFYPDVGGTYFLNKMPGHVGRYLALTTDIIRANDVLYIGEADYYIERKDWAQLETEILQKDWLGVSVDTELNNLLSKYQQTVDESSSPLAENQEKIDKHFSFQTVEEIFESLDEASNNGDSWASDVHKRLLTKSPISLKVTLEQLIKGKDLSLIDSLKMEFALSMNFMKNPDFYEGVRSVLVDKDRSPNWKYPRLEDVSEALVQSFFQWKDEWDEVSEKFDIFLSYQK